MTIPEFFTVMKAYHDRKVEEDKRESYFIAWGLTPYSGDFNNIFKTIFYGLHPEEKPSAEEEKAAFMEEFNL